MPKFRKKPVVVEAVQLCWDTWSEMCDHAGVGPFSEGKPQGCYIDNEGHPYDPANLSYPTKKPHNHKLGLQIPTLEGVMLATEGDWVIKGVEGELYPCKPDIFHKTHEPCE
jgi:hypothetical protein